MKRITFLFFGVLLVLTTASFVLAAETSGQLQLSNQGGIINVGGEDCKEDWSSSFWTECQNNTQTFVCIQTNPSCDTENLKPEQCDETRECDVTPPSSSSSSSSGSSGGSSSGGSSGGSSSGGIATLSITQNGDGICNENWQCGGWSNTEESCGTRSCTDTNACGTTELKPLTFKACSSTQSSGFGGGITSFFSAVGNSVGSGVGLAVILIVLLAGIVLWVNIAKGKAAITQTQSS